MSRRKGYIRWVAAALSTAVIVGALLLFVDVERAVEVLKQARPLVLVGAAAAFFFSLLLRAWRFAWVLNLVAAPEPSTETPTAAPPSITWRDGFDLAALSNIANHLLPMRMGELIFVYWATQLRISADRAIVGLLFCRLGDLVGMVIVIVGATVLAPSRLGPELRVLMWVLFGLAVLSAVFFAPLLTVACRILLRAVRPISEKSLGHKAQGFLERISATLPHLRQGRSGWVNIGVSTLIWCSVMTCFWGVIAGLRLGLPLGDIVLGSAGAALLPLVPLNVFGTVGPLEAGWAAGFVAVGLSRSDAVTSGILMHVLVIVVSAIAAAFTLGRVGFDVSAQFLSWWQSRKRS